MTATAWFLCPDVDTPSGGIRVIYRCVDHLVAEGIPAAIVHEAPGFRCTWFENSSPVTWRDELTIGPTDVLVVPELLVPSSEVSYPGIAKVVLNQNQYLSFRHSTVPPAPHQTELPASVIGIVVVSEDGLDYAHLAFPETPVERLHYGINEQLYFLPNAPKEKAICFMPRRRLDDLIQVLRILERRGSLDGWMLYPIDAMSEAAAADVMRRSAVFLSFNLQEGFGLPPVEAMASGCVVIGYHGLGGREYMKTDRSFPVEEGAVADYVRTVEGVLAKWEQGERFDDLTACAANYVRTELTARWERADVVRIISSFLDHTATTDVVRQAETNRA